MYHELGTISEMTAVAAAGHSFCVTVHCGAEQAAGFLLQNAQEAFAESRDEIATTLRGLSNELKRLANEAHPGPHPKFDIIEQL